MKNNNRLTFGHSFSNRDAGAISGTLELEIGDKVFIQHLSGVGSEAIHSEYASFTGYLVATT